LGDVALAQVAMSFETLAMSNASLFR